MSDSPNYPDILGTITGGERCNIGAAQVAVAARPRVIRAGRPFEVILLVQNASDGDIDVSMSLHLPPADAKTQRERFISKTQRLVVTVKGAEVGYVVLPATSLPDTPIGDSYKIGVEVEVRPLGKADRIRHNDGGGQVNFERLSEAARTAIEGLKPLTFTTTRPFAHSKFDVPLTVMSSVVGKMTDFTPGWVSVCQLSDYHDNRLLLHRYGALVQVNTLPKLKRSVLFKPLFTTTSTRFAEAGYPLKDAETTAIAKLMTLILEYASPRFNAHGNVAASSFNVEALLLRDPFSFEDQPEFPFWFQGLLSTLEHDERAASYPSQVIPRYLYEDLLRDAVNFGFELVNGATGEDLGSSEEQADYREQLIGLLTRKSGLDFNHVYLPLVMGGLLINDQFAVAKENPADLLREIGLVLDERHTELSDEDRTIYAMVNMIIARAGQRYGFYLGG